MGANVAAIADVNLVAADAVDCGGRCDGECDGVDVFSAVVELCVVVGVGEELGVSGDGFEGFL